MSRSAHTEAQIIGAVKQVEAGRKVEEVAREVGVSKHTIYAWKQKYGGLDVAEAQELKRLKEENAKLKKLVAEVRAGQRGVEAGHRKKRLQLVGSQAQLRQARADVERVRQALPQLSERHVCGLLEIAVSSLRRKKRKRLVRHHISTAPAQAANQEWALDFVTDALASDRHLRVLTVVDVFTRECLALETDTSLGSLRVIRVLEQIIAEHGALQRIQSDNGPEFTSRAYLAWALERRIELLHIRPGKPIENAYIESFNGRLREECLNVSWFRNLFDARRQIAAWRKHYNQLRPHSSLGYRTPEEFAAPEDNPVAGPAGAHYFGERRRQE